MDEWIFCPRCGAKLDSPDSACRKCGAATPSAARAQSGDASFVEDESSLHALTEELREALLPNLQLLKPLGQGGMGTVFLARDPALKRNVVVKVLSPALAYDENARKRFEREAQSAAAVSHPNVINVFQVGELPKSGTSYFVMQHVDGPTLAEAFPTGTVVPEARAKRIIGEVASALAAAHANGLVHRDIKPSNIMLEEESDRVVVLDFGISAAISPERQAKDTKLTAKGVSVGTPQYMSPEQAVGEEVTDKSDVYSLALIAFELLTGRPVFEAETPMALVAAHINKEAPKVASLRPDLDAQLAGLIDTCLAKDPDHRPAAREVAQYLVPPSQPVVEWPPPALQPLWRSGAALSQLAVRVVAAGMGFFVLLYAQPSSATGSWTLGESSWFWKLLNTGSVADTFIRPTECMYRRGVFGLGCPPASAEVTAIWLTGLLVLTGFIVLECVAIVREGGLLARMLRQARRCGYPEAVLMAVAWDEYDDTAALMNASGPYALESMEKRLATWRRRTGITKWYWLAVAMSAVLPALWLLGIVQLGGTHDRWLNGSELLLFLLPGTVAAIVRYRAVGGRRLLKVRGMVRGKRAGIAPVHRDLVDAWLGAFGNRWRQVTLPRARVVVPALEMLVLITLLSTITVVAGTWIWSLWTPPTLKSWAWIWMDHVDSEKQRHERWATVDSTLVDLFREQLLSAGNREESAPTFAEAAAAYSASWEAGWSTAAAAIAAAPYAPSDALSITTRSGRFEARLNAAALALDRGDHRSARQLVAENLALGRHLWRQPDAYFLGARALLGALAAGDSVMTVMSDSLSALKFRQIGERIDGGVVASARLFDFLDMSKILMIDPEAPSGERYVGRKDLAPEWRARLARSALTGFCANGREVLFGMAPSRRTMVARVDSAIADLPAVRDALVSQRRDLDGATSGAPGLFAAMGRFKWCLEKGWWN